MPRYNTQIMEQPVRRKARKKQLSIKSLHERVADDLRERIITGELLPGDRLAAAELGEEIGVSLTPVREALKVLASEQLVEIAPNRGARVAPIAVEHTRALFEVIANLESLAAELVAKHLSERQLKELSRLHERMRKHKDDPSPEVYFDINREIHDKIVEFANNEILSATRDRLSQMAERVRYFALRNQGRRKDAFEEHEALMAAFSDRDSEAAKKIWRAHLLASGEQTCELLAQRNAT